MSVIIVFTTFPSKKTAQKVAKKLIQEHLAGCVQILGPMESHYYWQNKYEKSREYLMLIKTIEQKYKKLETTIKEIHPYETPQILGCRVSLASETYTTWLISQVSDTTKY
jgi:periplasmic divalent cation tolerance protein